MPSIISHAAVPLAIGIALGRERVPRPLLIAAIAASMLPDADVILFRFGATYDDVWSHRGFSHSLGFAVLLGIVAALMLRRHVAPLFAFAVIAFSAASHGLLDMMTNGGHGIAILWPLSDQRYFFDWRPVQVSPLAASRLPMRATAIARTEILWVWLPLMTLAWVARTVRDEKGATT
jgi:inner membrane protein